MIATFSSLWNSITPALADHLWQSSLFAVAAGLLTLTLRKNHARARYWLWLAASVKFLVPFSWLISLGGRMSWLRPAPADTIPSAFLTVEQVSQPFSQSGLAAVPGATASSTFAHWLPAVLAIVWLAGFVGVLLVWCMRWRRISLQIRNAVPLHQGREIEALERVQHSSGVRKQIRMLLSKSMLEPGIFGMVSPVLVWPKGISDRLDNAHLEAILAHELWHVRRRDNLAAAMHMLVEALFWFHPLVWWLGTRLVDERERACDEEVLERGSERQVYAESILKVCEFCVGSPLACVAGVTGADLKKRMVHIMSEHVARKLDFSKKLLLTAVAAVALAAPIVFGLAHATPVRAQTSGDDATGSAASYSSVSIKPSAPSSANNGRDVVHSVRMMHTPDGFKADNVTLRAVIEEAYGIEANQVIGGPDWLGTATYDIAARISKPEGVPTFTSDAGVNREVLRPLLAERAGENRQMLQSLLADRAGLVTHQETRNLLTYALTIAESGSKLQPPNSKGTTVNLQGDTTYSSDKGQDEGGRQMKILTDHRMIMKMGEGQEMGLSAAGISADELAHELSRLLGIPVGNQTGLEHSYDFNLHWTRASDGSAISGDSGSTPPDPMSLLNAVQEQLGLKLTPQTATMQVLVIDHIEKPAGK
jgi:uncharacterized protein (TIGR03435 family)